MRIKTRFVTTVLISCALVGAAKPGFAHTAYGCGTDVRPRFVAAGTENQTFEIDLWHGTTYEYVGSFNPVVASVLANNPPPSFDEQVDPYTRIRLRPVGPPLFPTPALEFESAGGNGWTVDDYGPYTQWDAVSENPGISFGYLATLEWTADVGEATEDHSFSFEGTAYPGQNGSTSGDHCKAISIGPIPLHEGDPLVRSLTGHSASDGLVTVCAFGVSGAAGPCQTAT